MNEPQSSVSLETVAAITAALAAAMDQPVGSFVITGIQPVAPVMPGLPVAPSGWAQAGILESHLSRRQFGLRSR